MRYLVRNTGLVAEFHDRLRDRVCEATCRDPEPTAGIIDAQSVKAASSVPAASRGFDSGKNVNGRKRHIMIDTLGLPLTVLVAAASVTDRQAGRKLLTQLHRRLLARHAGVGRRRLHRTPGRLRPRRPERRTDRRQTHRQHHRVHRAHEVAGRADVRVVDVLTSPRHRLRGPHRQLGGDDPLVDEQGHEPPTRQATMLLQDRGS
ncbi:transposase [Streptomyces sp. NPDC006173]|uniref:transposase n=1 Tax=Streptomyces sp. NPDC006173 TaxID=3155349 RepID=UPI0033C04D93